MNRRIEKIRGAGGGLCSVLFILCVQVNNKTDRAEKNEIIIVIIIKKQTKFEPLAPCLFFRELQHNGLSSLQKSHSHRNRQTQFTSPLEFTAAQTSSPAGVSNPTCREINGLLSVSNI